MQGINIDLPEIARSTSRRFKNLALIFWICKLLGNMMKTVFAILYSHSLMQKDRLAELSTSVK